MHEHLSMHPATLPRQGLMDILCPSSGVSLR